jgi:tRNA pseudouridine55 synthase
MFALIRKPRGISSFECIRRFSKSIGHPKIGHAGTLDLLAEGLLLVATGRSPRLLSFVPHTSKTYEATIRFDGYTVTGDLESEVIPYDDDRLGRVAGSFSREDFEALLRRDFIGELKQTPSAFSAIWIDGKRAYELARKGKAVDMPSREITVFSLELLSCDFPECVIRAEVSSGTYIRTLADDIGQALGLRGYLTKLVRTAIGPFDMGRFQTPDEPFAEISMAEVFPDFPLLEMDEAEREMLFHGMPITDRWSITAGSMAFLCNDGQPVALMKSRDGVLFVVRNDLLTE